MGNDEIFKRSNNKKIKRIRVMIKPTLKKLKVGFKLYLERDNNNVYIFNNN